MFISFVGLWRRLRDTQTRLVIVLWSVEGRWKWRNIAGCWHPASFSGCVDFLASDASSATNNRTSASMSFWCCIECVMLRFPPALFSLSLTCSQLCPWCSWGDFHDINVSRIEDIIGENVRILLFGAWELECSYVDTWKEILHSFIVCAIEHAVTNSHTRSPEMSDHSQRTSYGFGICHEVTCLPSFFFLLLPSFDWLSLYMLEVFTISDE